jgi:hypothetical protein
MSSDDRHESIAQCILETLRNGGTDTYLSEEVRIEDYGPDVEPDYGITISPVGESEKLGTNERDDIEYATLITRTVHSLGQDDRIEKSLFRTNIRKLFHNKRIECEDGCFVYSRVEFGDFAIPRKWSSNNKSVSAMRVFTLVRESR